MIGTGHGLIGVYVFMVQDDNFYYFFVMFHQTICVLHYPIFVRMFFTQFLVTFRSLCIYHSNSMKTNSKWQIYICISIHTIKFIVCEEKLCYLSCKYTIALNNNSMPIIWRSVEWMTIKFL